MNGVAVAMPSRDERSFSRSQYREHFGHTFLWAGVVGDQEKMGRSLEEMKKALAGERGILTGLELGLDIPDDAVMQ